MKKNLFLVAMFAIVSAFSAQAQVIASFDFEDGTYNKWNVWNNKTNEVVAANKSFNSQHAVDVTSAMFFGIDVKDAKATYQITADVNPVWGGAASSVRVQHYDKSLARFVDITSADLPLEKGYKKFSMKFKTKSAGHYRVTFIPNGERGGRFIIDNVKLERIK